MHYLVTFNTNHFDLKNEKENPINPIKGFSVGEWIVPLLNDLNVTTSKIDSEDWGWYLYAEFKGSRYLLGFSAEEDEDGNENPVIVIQVDKDMTFLEMLLMKNQMQEDDGLLCIVKELCSQISDVKNLEIQSSR